MDRSIRFARPNIINDMLLYFEPFWDSIDGSINLVTTNLSQTIIYSNVPLKSNYQNELRGHDIYVFDEHHLLLVYESAQSPTKIIIRKSSIEGKIFN
jgi:hypothetical protein